MAEQYDYYQILGLDEHAEPEAVKKAYRACARALHPDRHPNDPRAAERFKGVAEAYAVLSDPVRRQQYDLLRRHPLNAFGRFPIAFAPRPRSTPRRKGFHIRLSFEQALRGGKTKIRLPDGRTAHVVVPKGVCDGHTIRLRRTGAAETAQAADDLFVTFHVAPSPRFRRSGDHLLAMETITVFEALFGTTRTIDNAYGQAITLPIPPGTQPSERLRLRGQGIARDTHTGDLFVGIAVTIPRDLTEEQRERLRTAAEDAGLL